MSFLSEPKNSLWICRILPFICFVIFGILYLVFSKVGGGMVIVSLMLIDFAVYGSFVLFYLPSLLFEGDFRLIRSAFGGFLGSSPWWYIPFAALTLGLGPIIWYWAKVDPVLLAMCRTGKR
jgi:hypothetical protein